MHCLKPPIHGHDAKLNRAKNNHNKLFLCLRPMVMDDPFPYSKINGGTATPILKFIDIDRKDAGDMFSRVYSTPEKDAAGAYHKKKSKEKFLRVVKAVLFETSLAKKIRKRSFIRQKKHSNGDPNSKVEMELNLVKEKLLDKKFGKKINGRSTNVSSKNSSSICSTASSKRFIGRGFTLESINSTVEKNDNNNNNERKQVIVQKNDEQGHYGSNTGLFFLLVTLFVLVLWGKVFAILCTSTWLFFVPNWSNISSKKLLKDSRSVHSTRSMDMEDYKKKIIMEGLLDRNRTRLP